MLNQFVIVGRVIELPEVKETSNSTKYAKLIVGVDRSFKNSDGIYEVDKIGVTLWRGIAEQASEVCNIGDVIGIKGRIQSNDYDKDGVVYHNYEIIAEKISFLSSKPE